MEGNPDTRRLTLDRPVTYQIKVPGEIDLAWADWSENLTITVEQQGDEPPVSTLTGTLDQAALQGILRRLYSLGLPLISAVWIDRAGAGEGATRTKAHPA